MQLTNTYFKEISSISFSKYISLCRATIFSKSEFIPGYVKFISIPRWHSCVFRGKDWWEMHWVFRWNLSEHCTSFQGVKVNSVAMCLEITGGQKKNIRVTHCNPRDDRDALVKGPPDSSQAWKSLHYTTAFCLPSAWLSYYLYIDCGLDCFRCCFLIIVIYAHS